MDNTIGIIPEFTGDETAPQEPAQAPIPEEVKPTEEVIETATPALPAEKPDETVVVESPAPSQDETEKAIQGLQNERVKLLKEISELKGTKREIKQDQLTTVQAQIDELKDMHPDDVATIEKVLRAKGYVTKDEQKQMFYNTVREEELSKFLERYPEYKPENDPDDVNWTTLQRELGFYRTPENPRDIAQLLERAHRGVVKVPSGPSLAPQKRALETAQVGAGGAQRSSPQIKLDPDKRAMLKGFSEEDIQLMEKKLNT